ncbi:MAG: isoprenyl transferase [Muribaculaceae bacterium]|nr:isoprenyl transferase [Muribaculaceae bacterium]
MSLIEEIDINRLPKHVAVIMDGNGRWAKKRNLCRSQGHVEGVNTVRKITEIASEIGISYLTLYAFSTENWNRPKEEVDALMNLIVIAIERETPDLIKNNVSLSMIGDTNRMPDFARERLQKCIQDTSHCTGLKLILALSYSSRWEIVNAIKKIAINAVNNNIDINSIDESSVDAMLTTNNIPDPDLLIRTGGDVRVSNFLLWQIAYSELYFTHKFWPDFSKDDFCEAIIDFQSRERRFGKTSEQIII